MKHKQTKRSISNKNPPPRPFQTQTRRLSTPHDHTRTITPNKTHSNTEPTQSDFHTLCLKPNLPLKPPKLLKRDLLRCSNQRPSLLGAQTLQTPRIHHGSPSIQSVVPSSFNTKRHYSLPDNPQTLHATIDRIGPWPDISINCLRSEGNDLLQPLKNFRNTKNSRLFSPKYYSALSENNTKFKFQPSKRSYIEDYRKQKGYVLSSHPTPQMTTLSSSSLGRLEKSEDDQLSVYGGTGSYTTRDRTDLSTTNLSIPLRGIVKSTDDIIENNRSQNNLPTLPIRNNNQLRTIRSTQQTVTLPTITSSSFQYLNSINSIETPYNDNKKLSIQNQSKLFFIDGRTQKRY